MWLDARGKHYLFLLEELEGCQVGWLKLGVILII